MSAKATWAGMSGVIAQLTTAPAEVKADGMEIVRRTTESAAAELRRSYPEASHTARGTGTLAARVRTVYPSSTLLVGQVQSRAPHADLWHFGSKDRYTKRGFYRGRMPKAAPEPLVPIAQRHRVSMYQQLRELLVRFGFQVQQ